MGDRGRPMGDQSSQKRKRNSTTPPGRVTEQKKTQRGRQPAERDFDSSVRTVPLPVPQPSRSFRPPLPRRRRHRRRSQGRGNPSHLRPSAHRAPRRRRTCRRHRRSDRISRPSGATMEDWDSEDFQPVAPVVKAEPLKNQWADEDVEEDDVKESWEEEEEEKPKPAPVEKAAAKPSTKAPAKKGKQQASTSAAEPDEPPLSPTSEKIRQQRLVEEADFKSTTELFAKKGGEQKSLDTFIPKSESDFAEYAELIANKLRPYEKSFHYMALLKNVMRLSMTSLKGADAKEISSSVTAIANEKIKAEKEAAAGKKKQGAKKKQLHIEKGDDDFIPGRGGGYDDPDEYDFM